MAAFAASASVATSLARAPVREFDGLRASSKSVKVQKLAMLPTSVRGKGAVGAQAYLGSPTNLIVVGTTTLFFIAGRFGLAPSANRRASPGLKLEDADSGLQTGDPANFTLADTLAFGALGHIVAVGIVLGLKNKGLL